MKKKLSVAVSLSLLATGVLAGCGTDDKKETGSSEKKDQTLRLTTTDEIPSMDSILATDELSFNVFVNTNEGLYRLGEDGKTAVPGVAESHTVSEDGSVYTFKLRESKWSNGEAVTAHDFEFAWKRALDPKSGSQYAYIMGDIKGATDAMNGKGSLDDVGVKALDDYTLQVTLQNAVPYFLDLTTFPTFFPQNEKFVKEQGKKYGLEANTTLYNGPFVMSDWQHNTSYQLKKNDNYWDKDAVKLKQVDYKIVKETSTDVNLYTTGQVDRIGLAAEYVDNYKDDKEFMTQTEPSVFYMRMNQDNEALANVNIRKAISLSLDKSGIVNEILNNGSQVADYFVPRDLTVSPKNGKDFRDLNGGFNTVDKEAAKTYWEKGLKELGVKTVKLDLINSDGDVSKKMSEYIKEQLESNLDGFELTIKMMPFKQKLALESKQDYDMGLGGWGADYTDPMTYLDMFTTDSSYNQSSFSNAEYDKLIADAKSTLLSDVNARYDALLKAEKILLDEEAVLVPIYQKGKAILQKSYVKNIVLHATGGRTALKWAYIE